MGIVAPDDPSHSYAAQGVETPRATSGATRRQVGSPNLARMMLMTSRVDGKQIIKRCIDRWSALGPTEYRKPTHVRNAEKARAIIEDAHAEGALPTRIVISRRSDIAEQGRKLRKWCTAKADRVLRLPHAEHISPEFPPKLYGCWSAVQAALLRTPEWNERSRYDSIPCKQF